VYRETTTVSDWKERLRADPRGTLAELGERLAGGRSPDSEIEDLYWRALVDFGTVGEITSALLDRLRPDAGPRLLDLDREHRTRCHGRLRVEAAGELGAFRLEEAEREAIAGHPLRLPETVYELRGRPGDAAALYVLEHDRLEERVGDAAITLARAALRYKLARALRRVSRVAKAAPTALAVMESALELAESLPSGGAVASGPGAGSGVPATSLRLRFHIHEWLGLRHYEARRFAAAEESFLRAAALVPDTELGVAVLTYAANAVLRQGRRAEARSLLDSLRGRLAPEGRPAEDRGEADGWESLYRRLQDELGED
jgi:tetratricopeptide (TPR) repeat protein